MDNQEQARTHTQGNEGHGAYVCYKCGWLFPNPHPSAKQRRAHKKICGTIEGCKLLVSESQNRLNASDDEHVFDDDCNTQVDMVPNSLDTGENEKQRGGTGEILTRSGDEVFLDAIANFSDGALSPGVRDPLRDSLESATDVELVHIKYPEFSRFSWDNDFNAAGASKNVMDCSLTSEIISNSDMIEIVVSSENSVSETCQGVSKLAVTDVVKSVCPVAGGAFSLNEKNNAEFLSVMPQTKLLLEVNSTQSRNGSTNGVLVESADVTQFATSTDVKMLREKGEDNTSWDVELDKAHPQNKYEEVKEHEGVSLQNSLSLHSSEGLKQKRDDLKDSVAVENNFLINPTQMSERREVLQDVHVLDSSMKEKNIIELVDEEIKEINNMAVDGKCRGANAGIGIKTKQPSNLHLDLEAKPSSGVYKSDEAVKIEKCNITDAQYKDKYANSNFEWPILSEVVMDRTISTRKGVESTNRGPLSGAQQDIKGDEVNSDGRVKVKATQCTSVVEDAQDGEPVKKCTGVPVCKDKQASSAIHTSVEPGNSDSLSVSVASKQSDVVQGVVGADFSSTDVLTSTEAAKFGTKDPKTASHRQQCEKLELFEPPSFMTLVEPGLVVGPKAAASEVHERTETNEHASSSQAAWFPTITNVTNESKGRKRNEEKIAEITNWSPSKQHKPLRTLLGEASRKMKPKSPKLEQNSVHQKNSGSGLTTGNSSIMSHESPATQAVKGKNGKERDSPQSAGTKRQNKKVKGRPYWIPLVCCSSADVQRS